MAATTGCTVALDNDLSKTKEIAVAIRHWEKQWEEAERKAQKEIRAHAETKQRIKAIEADQIHAKQAAEGEAASHELTKSKVQKEERHHAKTRLGLSVATDEVDKMRLQLDSMKVEMEAQRKAFVINVNWAARCTELKAQYDKSSDAYDQLFDQHVKAKSEMESALREQEDFKIKYQAGLDSLAAAQEDISRLAEEIRKKGDASEEVAVKLAELDDFRAKAASEAAKAKLGSQQALSVLQRSMAKGADGIKMSSFSGWASLTATEKKKRIQKDKAMKRALKTIASEGMSLLANVYKEWAALMAALKRAQLIAAQKRLEDASGNAGAGAMEGRQRAIAQLEKHFKGEEVVLKQTCFQGWALGQVARKKKEQNHKKASRMIANSGLSICGEIFGLWNDMTEVRRKKNRQHQANLKSAGRMIANSDKMLQQTVVQHWWGMIEGIRADRKVKEAGTAKAMRMLTNSGTALVNLCFDSWTKHYKESKKKEAGNNKALRMFADSAQALVIAVWKGWAKARDTKNAKDAGAAKAVRMINSSNEALQASVYQSWASDVRKNRDRNKKIRALEKSFGAQDIGKKMVVHTAWASWAKVEGRTKRAKEISMKTAIKSITGNQDLLCCNLYLVWAKCAKLERIDKLQEKIRDMEATVQDAVDKAKHAVEEDLSKAQTDVANVTSELEAMKKRREDVNDQIVGLEDRLHNTAWASDDYDRKIVNINSELNQSRNKAKDIGDELSKVGIFIASHQPRKTSRSGNSSRPQSGNRNVDDKLPRIDGSNSRPHSGTKADGSKSARGVAGERGGSGRREGRPPRNPEQSMERRYLSDGNGPYTYAEFMEIFADKGREVAMMHWNGGAVETQDPMYADY
jgi:predicted  nucleic acid-binding Zn-ribbon protein